MDNLFLFVEGNQDQIFAEHVLTEYLLNKSIKLWLIPYAQKTRQKVNKTIKVS